MLKAEFIRRPMLIALLVGVGAAATLFATRATADDDAPAADSRAPEIAVPVWTDATIDAASRIPVQAEGRVKPLSTFAAFSLLTVQHKRTYEDKDEVRHEPMAWLLRTMLHPEIALDDAIFRIDDSSVLDAIGLSEAKKRKRDLYSFRDLSSGLNRLHRLAHDYRRVDSKKRDGVQKQVLLLAHKANVYESILSFFWFAASGVPAPVGDDAIDGARRERIRLSDALRMLNGELRDDLTPEQISELQRGVQAAAESARALRLLAPLEVKAEEKGKAEQPLWMSPADIARRAIQGNPVAIANIEYIEKLEALYAARSSASEVETAMEDLAGEAQLRAELIESYDKIEGEVAFYRFDPFTKSLVFYIFAMLVVAGSWMLPRNRWLPRAAMGVVVVALLVHVAGIVWRGILRDRPPVTNLYETTLFISAICVLSMVIIEWITRRRIALSLAPALGALGLFISMRYEVVDAKDTMPQLIAVLDTNFWLWTHVTCISIGYSVGLIAAAIANVHVIGKAVGWRRGDKAFYRTLSRMVYGTLCGSLLFSVVGTILGGVWANDSWGRFWGWDPKENGALMICLCQIAIIHARQGGYIKGFGTSMAAILGGMIIAFSWWGVNLLGIGLHTYGFTESVDTALKTYYWSQGSVMGLGFLSWLIWDRTKKSPPAPPTIPAAGGPA